MLTFYGPQSETPIDVDRSGALPTDVRWVDALDPSVEELEFVKRALGTRVPSFEELSEIEASSRLVAEGGTLFMSLPATLRDTSGFAVTTPLGFVLSRDRLATIRFSRLPSFEHFVRDVCNKGGLASEGPGILVPLLESIIDQIADVLERVGGDLDSMSRQIFSGNLAHGKEKRPRRANAVLARFLHTIGENGDLVSKMSESLLGISRIVPFLGSKGSTLLTPELRARLDTVAHDATSLREFIDHLSGKTQFMLDALLGLANIEQNNVFRVLTVVSVVGIPPTFFASMYGMNFKNIPEYDWAWGYQWGLTLIVLSGLIPAIWFKVKGWW